MRVWMQVVFVVPMKGWDGCYSQRATWVQYSQ